MPGTLQPRLDAAIALLRGGDHAGAERAFRELLAEGERRSDRDLERMALVNLSATLIAQRRLDEAEALLLRAVQLARSQGFDLGASTPLYNLAWRAFYQRDFDRAARLTSEAAAAAGTSPPFDLGLLLALMDARLATRHGLFDLARAALARAAAAIPSARDPDLANQVLMAQGIVEYRAGQRAGLDLVLAGAANVKTADRQDLAARWLTGLAYLAAAAGDQDAASRLGAAAQRLARAPDFPTPEQCASYLKA
ncbi:MAG TPA: hypothetical protein VF160_09350 [Candidatus Dormibacteraeota bacterium]